MNAVNAENVILPSGTAKIGNSEYDIGLNGTPLTVQELNNLPVTTVGGGTIFLHDVANVRDGFAVQQLLAADGLEGTRHDLESNLSRLLNFTCLRAVLCHVRQRAVAAQAIDSPGGNASTGLG